MSPPHIFQYGRPSRFIKVKKRHEMWLDGFVVWIAPNGGETDGGTAIGGEFNYVAVSSVEEWESGEFSQGLRISAMIC